MINLGIGFVITWLACTHSPIHHARRENHRTLFIAAPSNPLSVPHTQQKGYDPDLGAPYGGAPVEIPGVIQPEEYDLGGPGVGYYDTTPGNRRGVRRVGE